MSRLGALSHGAALCAVLVGLNWLPKASAATLSAGDIVVAVDEYGQPGVSLMRVDPTSGALSVISDATHGAGPLLSGSNSTSSQNSLARVADGHLIYAGANGVFSVDPVSGDRSLLSAISTRSIVASGNDIYGLVNSDLVRIDSVTGASTLLAGGVGGLAMALDHGELLIGDNAVTRYSLSGTNLGTVLSPRIGATHYTSIAVLGDSVFLLDSFWLAMFNRLSPPANGIPTGVPGQEMFQITADGNGRLLALISGRAGFNPNILIRPADDNLGASFSGTQPTILIQGGADQNFNIIYAMTVVPEPTTLVLCATAIVGLAVTKLPSRIPKH